MVNEKIMRQLQITVDQIGNELSIRGDYASVPDRLNQLENNVGNHLGQYEAEEYISTGIWHDLADLRVAVRTAEARADKLQRKLDAIEHLINQDGNETSIDELREIIEAK